MRVAVILVDRANLGRLLPIIEHLDAAADIELLPLICGGTMILPRFDYPANQLLEAGYRVYRVYGEIEGGTHAAMVRSMGQFVGGFAGPVDHMKPDYVVMIGDRYEALAAAQAVVGLRVPLIHFQGGETSGTLDNRWRWAITALADYHVPATEAEMKAMNTRGVLTVGCPSSDVAAQIPDQRRHRPLVIFHPDTDSDLDQAAEVRQVLAAVPEPFDIAWPNIDPGHDEVWREIRTCEKQCHRFINKSPREYMAALAAASVCVGNSSSFARDAGMVGTPVVLVGDRQRNRQTSSNVMRVSCREQEIREAVNKQLRHGPYRRSKLYGDGNVGANFIEALRRVHCNQSS